jgi:hypothetical protein
VGFCHSDVSLSWRGTGTLTAVRAPSEIRTMWLQCSGWELALAYIDLLKLIYVHKKNSMASVRKLAIPTELPPLVSDVSANFFLWIEGATWLAWRIPTAVCSMNPLRSGLTTHSCKPVSSVSRHILKYLCNPAMESVSAETWTLVQVPLLKCGCVWRTNKPGTFSSNFQLWFCILQAYSM